MLTYANKDYSCARNIPDTRLLDSKAFKVASEFLFITCIDSKRRTRYGNLSRGYRKKSHAAISDEYRASGTEAVGFLTNNLRYSWLNVCQVEKKGIREYKLFLLMLWSVVKGNDIPERILFTTASLPSLNNL